MVVGDTVYRYFGDDNIPAMELKITKITDDWIVCGDYTFFKVTGLEFDDYLEWNCFSSGSYIKSKKI
jgi:hypothetical protein